MAALLKPLRLDFIPHRRIPVLGILLLLAALVFGGYVFHQSHLMSMRNQEWRQRIQDRERGQRALSLPQRSAKAEREAAQIAQARQAVLRGLHYPWPEVLAEIEHAATPESINLLTFEHDIEAQQTRLKVEARDLPALLVYLQTLNAGKPTSPWSLVNHRPASGSSGVQAQLIRKRAR